MVIVLWEKDLGVGILPVIHKEKNGLSFSLYDKKIIVKYVNDFLF